MDWVNGGIGRLKESWGTKSGLLGALVLPLLLLQLVPEAVWSPVWLYWASFVLLETLVFGAWYVHRVGGFFPAKIRLVLAIYYDKEEQRAELEEDFGKTLRHILREGDLGKDISIIMASRAECHDLECDADFSKLSDQKKAHLLLYGRIRTRQIDKQEVHLLEMRAIVRHAKINEHARQAFAEEISSVFPSATIRIPKNDQLPHFRITAEWIGFSSRYVLSLAAATAGDFDYAEKILKDAELLLPRLPANIKQLAALEERIKLRLHEMAVMQARRSYAAWRVSREVIEVERVRERLEFAGSKGKLRPENVHLLAQAMFVATLDASGAEKMIRPAMFDHAVAHLNLAFLLAWQGKFADSRKSYRAVGRHEPDADVLDQVFTFFDWLRSHSPDNAYICNWCEAVLRVSTKKDLSIADRIFPTLFRMSTHFPPDEIARIKSHQPA